MGPFSNGSSHNGRQGAGKGELEEPVVILDVVTSQEEICISNKSLALRAIISAIRKSVSNGPKAERDKR